MDVGGVNPWDVKWTPTGGHITVAHPSYQAQRHTMFTYGAVAQSGTVAFAAGEFSNGVWGFLVPE
jgi:hypothetical protein